MHRHPRNGFLAVQIDVRPVRVWPGQIGGHRRHGGKVRILDHQIDPLRHRPHPPVAVGRHHVALAHLLLHHPVVGDIRFGRLAIGDEPALIRTIGQRRPPAIHVVAVHCPIALVPFPVLLVDGRPQPPPIPRRRRFTQQSVEQDRRQSTIPLLVQVQPVHRQRPTLPRCRRVQLQRSIVEVHEQHPGRPRHLPHRPGIPPQIRVVRCRVRIIRILMPLLRDGRDQNNPGRTPPGIVAAARLLEPSPQIRAKALQPSLASKRLVEPEKRQNHIRPHLAQPVVRRTEILRSMPHNHFVTRHPKVAHHQLMPRILRMQQRLEIPRVLHPIGQGIPNNGHTVAGP